MQLLYLLTHNHKQSMKDKCATRGFFKALLSGGTKNEATKWETRASTQLASGLVHAHQPRGVSHFMNQLGGDTTLFFRQQGNYISFSHAVGVSLVRWNPLNAKTAYHNTKTIKMVNIPNSRWLKIKAAYASAKLAGLRACGCGGFTTLRSTQTQTI